MKILVTVGTTRFDSLIEFIDRNIVSSEYDIEFQIADGRYTPTAHPYFRYIDSIDDKYKNSDVVITHAGAVTIYKLLELQKKMIIVPNLERSDAHQRDIADYMHTNGYAYAVTDYSEIPAVLNRISSINFLIFNKREFFKASEILSFIIDEPK